MTNKISYLDDGDLCVLSKDKVEFYDSNKKKINKKVYTLSNEENQSDKETIKILCQRKSLNNQQLLKIVLTNM